MRQLLCQRDGQGRGGLGHIGGWHLRDGEDATAMQVLLHRQVHHHAIGAARDDDADLQAQRQALLQHAGHAAQSRPGSRQFGSRQHRGLALAVVTQAGSFQDAGQQRRERRRAGSRCCRCGGLGTVDQHMRRTRHTRRHKRRFLARAMLANLHRRGKWRHGATVRQAAQCGSGHILKFGGDGSASGRQFGQCGGVGVGGAQVVVGCSTSGAVAIGFEHRDAITMHLRGVHKHTAELTTTEHTQARGAGQQRAHRLQRWHQWQCAGVAGGGVHRRA